jgi:hypothetical protein
VVLHGTKLRGGFTFIRTGKRSIDRGDNELWLIVRQRDEYVDPSWNIEDPGFDRSVLTGRSMKEIESGRADKTPSSSASPWLKGSRHVSGPATEHHDRKLAMKPFQIARGIEA